MLGSMSVRPTFVVRRAVVRERSPLSVLPVPALLQLVTGDRSPSFQGSAIGASFSGKFT